MSDMVRFEQSDQGDLQLLGFESRLPDTIGAIALIPLEDIYFSAAIRQATLTPEPYDDGDHAAAVESGYRCLALVQKINDQLRESENRRPNRTTPPVAIDPENPTPIRPPMGYGRGAPQLRAQRALLMERYQKFADATAPGYRDSVGISPKKFLRLEAIMEAVRAVGGARVLDNLNNEAASLSDETSSVKIFA